MNAMAMTWVLKVKFKNDLIFIFMKFNEISRNMIDKAEKDCQSWKNRGFTYKIKSC